MIKTAYHYGVAKALRDLGVMKLAEEDQQMGEPQPQQNSNPADLLAQLFQQADIQVGTQSPDNKTKNDDNPYQHAPHWGKAQQGHGGEALERNAPGFNMPMSSSI